MTIVNKKFYDSAFTLPLVTTQSTSTIKLKTVPYPLLCLHETGTAPILFPDPTYVKLVMGLHSWCREAEGTQEYVARQAVAQKIQKCYISKEPTLKLSSDLLTSLPEELGNLSQLTELELHCRALTSLPETIGNLSNLTEILLGCHALTSLPATIGSLSQLTKLVLCCNRLTSLPATIGNLSQLTTLMLALCLALTSLPPEIGNLSNLTNFEVIYCSALTSLPPSIGNLSKLTNLMLNCPALTSLPATIDNLSNLTKLQLANCQSLTSLPEELGNLSNLTTLEVSFYHALTSLPATIGNLSNLTTLKVSSCNALTSLPATIGNLSKLTTLKVSSCNALTSLPNALARLPRECVLDTEFCGLDARASTAFQDALIRARMENPTHGPQWRNTVRETPLSDTNTFDETLEQYLTLIDKIPELKTKDLSWFRSEAFKNQFSEEDKNLLNQFLKKIKNTKDFKEERTHGGTLSRISYILEACSNSNFKESLFWLIRDALDSCSDRAAITLNRIEVQRQLLSSELASDLKKLSHFLVTCQRLQLVHEEAAKIIEQKNLGDAIEPMLFLQIQLKKLLDLPIATEGMLYPAMASITKDEIKEIGLAIIGQSELREQQIEILCTPPQTIYNAAGMPIKTGNISPTNPFFLNIPEFWEKALTSKYPKEFKDIEPPSDDRELRFYLTSEELQEYNKATDPETVISRVQTQKKQALILELTKNII